MKATPELWEVNQGKRLLKRLKAVGVKPGEELSFTLQALITSAATVAVAKSKRDGEAPEKATEAAMAAMGTIKPVAASNHPGVDLVNLMVVNGAAPGRVKAELDKVLFVAGITNDCPYDMRPANPDEDRFPKHSVPRENY